MDERIAQHCAELNRCNQRGGRMLSVLDLLDAGTLDLDLAAFLMARIARGASFMVGARPGGAGKTTVMCALLNLVPADVPLAAATAQAVRSASEDSVRRCYICHEIGSGPYFAYLWGHDLRAYAALGRQGHILATNLHADDRDETFGQVCEDNGVPEEDFSAFDLLVYLRVGGGWSNRRHWIETVSVSDGVQRHVEVFNTQSGLHPERAPGSHDAAWTAACRAFIEELCRSDVRAIEDVRPRVVEFLKNSPSYKST
ncbi:MAG TPA: hypothetical protein PLO37_00175 [Candidatus Hydrogenedentes bacterium]|nr:hypothetical protein [Candidatus Hydrogenedentota bacterium]HPG65228.1 hypothetical protein [Candidatus Hydrogenedentota bacterium]